MNIEDLQESLEEILPPGFSIVTNSKGQVVIMTNLHQDDDGELLSLDEDEDEEDPDFDPDFEPLEEDDDEEE